MPMTSGKLVSDGTVICTVCLNSESTTGFFEPRGCLLVATYAACAWSVASKGQKRPLDCSSNVNAMAKASHRGRGYSASEAVSKTRTLLFVAGSVTTECVHGKCWWLPSHVLRKLGAKKLIRKAVFFSRLEPNIQACTTCHWKLAGTSLIHFVIQKRLDSGFSTIQSMFSSSHKSITARQNSYSLFACFTRVLLTPCM